MNTRCVGRTMAMLWLLAAIACRHIPTEKERQGAEIHYDLGLSAQQGGDLQGAMAEIQTALSLDPGFAEAHNAMGVLLHNGFKRLDEAIEHYKKALEIRPDFSQAKTNLANVYVDQGRYDQAIKLYQEALNDMLYREPHIAQGNLGWALYKKGDTRGALDHIRTAVTLEPKFCLGYQWLGIIETEQRDLNSACRDFGKYREACPEVADAYYREGSCLAKLGQRDAAKQSFTTCQAKAPNDLLRGECRRLAEQLH